MLSGDTYTDILFPNLQLSGYWQSTYAMKFVGKTNSISQKTSELKRIHKFF